MKSFKENIQFKTDIWQKYEPGLCPNAEFLQPRMIQLKTNYWNLKEALNWTVFGLT